MSTKVVIQSRLSGSVAGCLELNSNSYETVDGLISTFCNEKGTRLSSRYRYVLRNGDDEVLDSNKALIECGIVDGEKLYFTKPKEDVFGFQNWYLMAGFGLIHHSSWTDDGDIPDSVNIFFFKLR